jgi:hypothetical protein
MARRWIDGLRAGALSLLMCLPPPGGGSLTAAATALVLATPSAAEARAGRSSGGYSRPSTGYARPSAPVSRTPSVGIPAPRAPSSGGYSRPSSPSFDGSVRRPSVGDLDISRRNAGEALREYRQQQERQRAPTPPTTAPAPTVPSVPSGGGFRVPRYGPSAGWGSRPDWYWERGWSIPPYAYARPSFGLWNGVFLWFLLDTLTRPGHADWFYNHQNDPGYQQWRAEADRLARDNAELRAKLDQLDRDLAQKQEQGEPRNPDYLPPDTPPEVAAAPPAQPAAPESGGAGGALLIVVVIGGGVLFLLWMWRRHHGVGAPPRPRGGSTVDTPLKSAVNILRHKVSGEGYTPQRFRVGMTLTLDPTPFVLAGGATKVPPPQAADGGTTATVQAVGTLADGTTLHRLYLDERSFFQLHLDAAGNPDECRYFGQIDEVMPADRNEWGFWLDPNEGMIGWPQFQTKDGKLYERAWSPGATRIAPIAFTETRQDANGTRTARLAAMLYAASTGAAAPAPATEYILVAAVEAEGGAAVAVHAGIDVNPAMLSLT